MSTTEKSHVSVEQHVCKVCGTTYDTNAILLDKLLRQSMERHTLTGYGLCPEHQKLFDAGYVALVGADPDKSELLANGNIKPEGAYRTGKLIHLRREAFARTFDTAIPDTLPMVFCDDEVIALLTERAAQAEES